MTLSAADGVALGVEAFSARMDDKVLHDNQTPIPLQQQKPQISTRDAVVVAYDANGWPMTFRTPGSPAGTFPHCSWWHCALCDEYERVNVWSHFLPGLLFLFCGSCQLVGDPYNAQGRGLGITVFCVCSCLMHCLSALTHVYPDDIYLEKLDHLGIASLVMGTPISTILVRYPQDSFDHLAATAVAMVIAAFLRPALRTLLFGVGVMYIYATNFWKIHSMNMMAEVLLYAIGGFFFLRNKGHQRWPGLQDHHFLHYASTTATFIHLAHLIKDATSSLQCMDHV